MKRAFVVAIMIAVFLAAVYFMFFVICSSGIMLPKQIRNAVKFLTNRESYVNKASFSPAGFFEMKDFELSNKPDFKSGKFMSIKNVAFNVVLMELFRSKLVVNDVNINGFDLYLNYKNKRKFNTEMCNEIKNKFLSKFAKYIFVKNIKVSSFVMENGNVYLETDMGNVQFANIALTINSFDISDDIISGNIEFIFKKFGVELPARLEFRYNKSKKSLSVIKFVCENLSISGKGDINFIDDDYVKIECMLNVDKQKAKNLIFDIIGLSARNLESGSITFSYSSKK
jgi:hypothetical protein